MIYELKIISLIWNSVILISLARKRILIELNEYVLNMWPWRLTTPFSFTERRWKRKLREKGKERGRARTRNGGKSWYNERKVWPFTGCQLNCYKILRFTEGSGKCVSVKQRKLVRLILLMFFKTKKTFLKNIIFIMN